LWSKRSSIPRAALADFFVDAGADFLHSVLEVVHGDADVADRVTDLLGVDAVDELRVAAIEASRVTASMSAPT